MDTCICYIPVRLSHYEAGEPCVQKYALVSTDAYQHMQTEFVKTESKTIFKKAPSLKNQPVNGELFTLNEAVTGTLSNIFENQDGQIIFLKTPT